MDYSVFEIVLAVVFGAAVLFGIGNVIWHLFNFIADTRREEGKTYTNTTKKGFLWKEFLTCIWKTALVLIIAVIGILILGKLSVDTDDVSENDVITEDNADEDDNKEYSWEVDYKIPDGIMESISNSSAFSEIGYDKAKEVLIVRFKNTGKAYIYLHFTESDWNSFKKAKSLGSYYNKNIKGKYTSYKLVKG